MYWLIVIGSFILLLNLIGLMYSRTVKIWSKIEINASPISVFNSITDFHEFVKWSPWSNKDPKISQKFSEAQGEIGSTYSWKGNRSVGIGKMTLTDFNEFSSVKMDVSFGRNPLSKVEFNINETDAKSTVMWSMLIDLGPIPATRILSGMISKSILKDFNQGLKNLKNHSEK